MPKVVHFEIPSTDLARASAFYAALFHWPMTPFGDDYVVFSGDGGLGGGIQKVDAPPGRGIAVYVGVEDIPATLAKAKALGAKVLAEKTGIGGGYGFWAAFEDPCGGRSVRLWSQT